MLMCSCETSTKTVTLKQDYINLVEQYIDQDDSNHISYIILPVSECVKNDPSLKGFVIGPLYSHLWNSFKEERCHQVYCYKGKNIYLYTSVSDLFDLPINQQSVEYCKRDSCFLFEDVCSTEASLNYFRRAWLMSISGHNVVFQKNIDTLFLPIIKKDTPMD